MNDLAEIYFRRGVKPGKISKRIAEATGYALVTVQQYLETKYKDEERRLRRLGKTVDISNISKPSVVDEAKRILGEQKFKQRPLLENTL